MADHKPEHKSEHVEPDQGKKVEAQVSAGTAKDQYHEAKQMQGLGDKATAPKPILGETPTQVPVIEDPAKRELRKPEPIGPGDGHGGMGPLNPDIPRSERGSFPIPGPGGDFPPRPPHPEPFPIPPGAQIEPIPQPGDEIPIPPEHHGTGLFTKEELRRWENEQAAHKEAEKCGDKLSDKQKQEVAEGLAAILNHDDKALAKFLKDATPEERAAFIKGLKDLGYDVTETTTSGTDQSTKTHLTIAKHDNPLDVTHVDQDDHDVNWDPTKPHPFIHMQPTIDVTHDR